MKRARAITPWAVVVLLGGLLTVLGTGSARAADGSSPVSCPTPSSCTIQVQSPGGGGGGDGGTGNGTPACKWVPVGDAQAGSQYILDQYKGGAPAQSAPYGQYGSYVQARQMLASRYTQPGEWYTLAVRGQCPTAPIYIFAVPGQVLPGGQLTGLTPAQLATARIDVPGAGKVKLNPKGNSYSNLPTYVQVTLDGRYQIAPGGMPYVRGTADVRGAAATVWITPTGPLSLSSPTDNSATLYTNGCAYLGSTKIALNQKTVANTGINGGNAVDCGLTFHLPGTQRLHAELDWRACWLPEVVYGPPPANCAPVAGAILAPTVWAPDINVREIQANNGSGTPSSPAPTSS